MTLQIAQRWLCIPTQRVAHSLITYSVRVWRAAIRHPLHFTSLLTSFFPTAKVVTRPLPFPSRTPPPLSFSVPQPPVTGSFDIHSFSAGWKNRGILSLPLHVFNIYSPFHFGIIMISICIVVISVAGLICLFDFFSFLHILGLSRFAGESVFTTGRFIANAGWQRMFVVVCCRWQWLFLLLTDQERNSECEILFYAWR